MEQMHMQDVGRWMIVGGLLLTAGGAVVWLLARLGFRGLPGDVSYRSPHVQVYFPIVSCVVLSLILTALLWLWQWFERK
jgi:hypothetical protein